jgi:SAM-dependent methyltransferase
MQFMFDLKSPLWDKSYTRGENYIFFPKDETVKFLNRFIRKRNGIDSFVDKIKVNTGNALDFGCGVGRQTILLSEFGFNAFGLDISHEAILVANELKKKWMLPNNIEFSVLSGLELPFANCFFDFGICDSVLDSMEFQMAKAFIAEFDRVTSGIFFLTLISEECNENGAGDLIVQTPHEYGTIQSYYDIDKINDLINQTSWRIKWINLKKEYDTNNKLIDARFHIVLDK